MNISQIGSIIICIINQISCSGRGEAPTAFLTSMVSEAMLSVTDAGGFLLMMNEKWFRFNNTLSCLRHPPPREGVACAYFTQRGYNNRTTLVPSPFGEGVRRTGEGVIKVIYLNDCGHSLSLREG